MNRQTRWQKTFRVLVIDADADTRRRLINHCNKYFARSNILIVTYTASCIGNAFEQIKEEHGLNVIVITGDFPEIERLQLRAFITSAQISTRLEVISLRPLANVT